MSGQSVLLAQIKSNLDHCLRTVIQSIVIFQFARNFLKVFLSLSWNNMSNIHFVSVVAFFVKLSMSKFKY